MASNHGKMSMSQIIREMQTTWPVRGPKPVSSFSDSSAPTLVLPGLIAGSSPVAHRGDQLGNTTWTGGQTFPVFLFFQPYPMGLLPKQASCVCPCFGFHFPRAQGRHRLMTSKFSDSSCAEALSQPLKKGEVSRLCKKVKTNVKENYGPIQFSK